MAYKFQVGAAIMSGSLTQEGDITGEGNLALANSATIGCAADADLITLASTSVAFANNVDVNVAKAGGLQIAGAAVTSTATEINLLDAITRGSIIYGNSSGASARLAAGSANTVLSTDGTDIGYSQIDNAMIDSSAGIQLSKLESVTSARIIVGNGSNVATAVAMSGDIAIDNAGATTIQANAVEGSMLNNNIVSGLDDIGAALATTDELIVSDNGTIKRTDLSRLSTMMQSTGLADSSGQLSVAAAQTSISSIYNAGLIVGRGASDAHIDFSTDDQIQFDIDNAATLNLSANGINLQQGGIQVPAGADIDAAGAGAANLYASVGANNLTIGGSTSTVVIPGNLTVSGTTVEIDAAFVVTSSIQFEGVTPDGNEISLTSADPSADRTITLPDLTGHIPLIAGAIGNANVTAAEFLLLDGGSSVGTDALADADGFMHNDNGTMKHTQVIKIAELAFSKVSGDATVASNGALTIANDAVQAAMLNDDCISGFDDIGADIAGTDELLISDAGTLKRTDMSRLKTFIGSGTAAITEHGDADRTMAVGVNVATANMSANRTWTLPASAGLTAGESVKIKAAGLTNGNITIARAGSQTIDGSLTSIVLESSNAAVELVYVGADDWRLF